MTPTFEVQIYDFNDTTIPVRLVTLAAWHVALQSESRGQQVTPRPVAPIVRQYLSAPANYPVSALSEHITTSYYDIKRQLDI